MGNSPTETTCSCGVPYELHLTCCGWGNANIIIFPGERIITLTSAEDRKRRWEYLQKVRKEAAQKTLGEAAEAVDKIKMDYKEDNLYSDGYNAAINDALEFIVQLKNKYE